MVEENNWEDISNNCSDKRATLRTNTIPPTKYRGGRRNSRNITNSSVKFVKFYMHYVVNPFRTKMSCYST